MSQTQTRCCGPDCCADAGDARPAVALAAGGGDPPPAITDGGGELRAIVRARYAEAARTSAAGAFPSCGCGTCSGDKEGSWDPITSDLYDAGQTAGIPAEALLASLGCGNPTALAELREGETVLDLGSGGGIDVLLSARRVGPTGKAYGLDMTDEMLELAQENKAKSGLSNVEFLRGEIERIPLPARSIDVIISNCVINLSADKRQVLREAYRVLRPGGRFAVADVVLRGVLPESVRRSIGLWTGCVAGALHEDEYRSLLTESGFSDVDVEATRVYSAGDARALLSSAGLDDEGLVVAVEGKVMSAFVRARKPF